MILTNTPHQMNSQTYYYNSIINGYYIDMELPPKFFAGAPLKLKSIKLGEYTVNLLHYIRSDNKESYDINLYNDFTNTKYTRKQIQLVYDYFGYNYGENLILTIPNYKINKNKPLFLAFLILITAYEITQYRSCNIAIKKNKLKNSIIYIFFFLVSMYIASCKIITFLQKTLIAVSTTDL